MRMDACNQPSSQGSRSVVLLPCTCVPGFHELEYGAEGGALEAVGLAPVGAEHINSKLTQPAFTVNHNRIPQNL
jgi:hypothetical protein